MRPNAAAAALAILILSIAEGSEAKDIVQTAKDTGKLSMFLQAIKSAGLEEKLKSPGPFTIFAPTDDSFRALPPEVAKRLLDPANKDELANVLSYHVLAGRLITSDLKAIKRCEGAFGSVYFRGQRRSGRDRQRRQRRTT